MNVLFVETSLDPNRGGVQRVTWLLSNFFLKKGIDCFYAYHLVDYKSIDECKKLEFDLSLPYDELYEKISGFVIRNNIDVIINQDRKHPVLLLVYRKLRDLRICKIIHSIHISPDFFKHINYSFLTRIKMFLFRKIKGYDYAIKSQYDAYWMADYVVLLSESFVEDYVSLYRIPDASKVLAISNPLSFSVAINEDSLQKKDKTVLIVARFEERQKNIKGALRIWKLVEETQNSDWNLILAGYGPDEKSILRYAEKLQLKRFRFIGKVDQPQKLYEKSSLFMMTSNYEGFGMTLTEALQNACIPIAFNTYSAVNDIIQDGYNGFLVPANDERTYSKKIIELINNEELRFRMRKNALFSSEKFNIENIGNQWVELLNKMKSGNIADYHIK